jgi:hypothetical protein
MRREDIRKLLGGYATGTLTAEERQALFEAALDDQELFDALAKEQPLRDLLEDPAARAHLLAALDDGPLPGPRRLEQWLGFVGQALSPANRLPRSRRFERWLWGHAVGVAAVACFLTVGGYVVWQYRDSRKPTLIAEMERHGIEAPGSPPSQNPASPPPQRRAFNPGAVTNKPAPAPVAEPGPPPVIAPPRPAPTSLPLPQAAPPPPPPAPESKPVAAAAGVRPAQPEAITVSEASPFFGTRAAPAATPAPATATSQGALRSAVTGREGVGVVGGVPGGVAAGAVGGFAAMPMAAGQAKGLSLSEGRKGARELYDPALATAELKAESAPVQAGGGRGGGGGFAARPRSQAAEQRLADAARPAASLGVRYQVLRRVAGGAFEELAAASDLAAGDTIKLRFIPNYTGYLSVVEAGAATGLLESRVERFAPAETPEIRLDQPGRRVIYALFAREDQPPVTGANADSFRAGVLQGASGMLSQAAGMEGVYVVNAAPGAPSGVPFLITLNVR